MGWTAVAVATARAAESSQASPWFHDPLAAEFVAAASQRQAPPVGSGDELWRSWVAEFVRIRTRFFDDYLVESGCAQVVLLAAGLDARAFRLPWPQGTRLFELDLPDMIDFKDRVLATRPAVPICERITVGIDLREDWPAALAEAAHRPDQPTAWLAEGLHPYLDDDAYDRLLYDIGRQSAVGSRLGLDHHDQGRRQAMIDTLHRSSTPDHLRPLWRSGGDQDPVAWLARYGWRATAHSPAEQARRYGRPLPSIVDAAVEATGYPRLITAV